MGLSDMSFLAFYAFRHVLFLLSLMGFLSFSSLCCFSNFFFIIYIILVQGTPDLQLFWSSKIFYENKMLTCSHFHQKNFLIWILYYFQKLTN